MDWKLIPAILCLIATNASAQIKTPNTTTDNSTNTPPVAAAFNLAFSINETFAPALANTSSQEFAEKAKSIRNQLEPIYKQKFKNFIRMVIHSLRNGSILVNSTLEFNVNGSIPNDTIVQSTLLNATTTNSSLNILANSVNVTVVPATNASVQIITGSTITPPVAAAFNLAFSINETFAPALANTSSQEFAEKAKSIRNQLEPIYKQKFKNFIRMVIHSLRNGSILVNSTLEFNVTGSIPNDTIVQSTLVNATTTNSSLNILANSVNVTVVPATNASAQTTTPSPPTTSSTITPPVAAAFNLAFSINETFVPALANTSSQEFAEKAKSIRKQLEPIYKQKFKNFIRMVIHSLRNGSILVNSSLEFNANGSIPNDTIVQSTLVNATTTNSSLNILANSVNVTEIPATNASAQTTTPSPTTTITPPVAAAFNLVFKINETFVPVLANTSSPDFSEKAKSIRKQLEPIYKQKFQNFIRMVIHSLRNGSILVNSTLEFSANGSIPNDTIVQSTLVNATTTNSSLNILANSVNVTVVPVVTNSSTTNSTSTPQIVTAIFNLIFSIKETFDAALANKSSPQFATKSKQIRNGVEPLYKKAFQNFLLMEILNFKNGSIVTNSILSFGPGGNVTEAQVKDTLANGLANLNFPVDPNSINVTQILGNSMPPVIASSLSMIWLSLLSLLLSVTLHC